ncbi:hypothetical protein [Acidihalobacter ferrooxydans]|uniref:Uncharacterized protein n=1 Tax=Acidihalobacter ferrooxydans TaxID=1765967 RepID=A0A1P8UFV2_9GAMM|nr:hypothetical protein [Acidihalobacter ferrooxydans]APZ42727.1 hypothetical protein BW247_06145 [Acidihalobacter ferrooxydans]
MMETTKEHQALESFFVELWQDADVSGWCVAHSTLYGLSLGLAVAGVDHKNIDLLAALAGHYWMEELFQTRQPRLSAMQTPLTPQERIQQTVERTFQSDWKKARHETGEWSVCANRLEGMALALKALHQSELAKSADLLARLAVEHERCAAVLRMKMTQQLRASDDLLALA